MNEEQRVIGQTKSCVSGLSFVIQHLLLRHAQHLQGHATRITIMRSSWLLP